MTAILRVLDALHLRERYGGARSASRGAWPHFRSPGMVESSASGPRNGLPENAYNSFWLSHLPDWRQFELQVAGKIDLKIPKAIEA